MDQAMWQAPTLTITAQAFLLAVLTADGVGGLTRFFVLIAGLSAIVAAARALLRLRAREVQYSEAIEFYLDRAPEIPGLLPDDLPAKPITRHTLQLSFAPKKGRLDKWLRRRALRTRMPTVHLFWLLALVLFAVADVVAWAQKPSGPEPPTVTVKAISPMPTPAATPTPTPTPMRTPKPKRNGGPTP